MADLQEWLDDKQLSDAEVVAEEGMIGISTGDLQANTVYGRAALIRKRRALADSIDDLGPKGFNVMDEIAS